VTAKWMGDDKCAMGGLSALVSHFNKSNSGKIVKLKGRCEAVARPHVSRRAKNREGGAQKHVCL